MRNLASNKKGISILGAIIFGLILILLFSYFHISIRAIVESPAGQDNLNYARQVILDIWNNYLSKPVLYLWDEVWIKLLWNPFISSNVNK